MFPVVPSPTFLLLQPVPDNPARILYCRCAFAQVVPQSTKNEVLEGLCASGASFESASDLCEMSARKDPRLREIVEGTGPLRIAACHPRAVKWLFHHADAPLPEEEGAVEVLNMRDDDAGEIVEKLVEEKPSREE